MNQLFLTLKKSLSNEALFHILLAVRPERTKVAVLRDNYSLELKHNKSTFLVVFLLTEKVEVYFDCWDSFLRKELPYLNTLLSEITEEETQVLSIFGKASLK